MFKKMPKRLESHAIKLPDNHRCGSVKYTLQLSQDCDDRYYVGIYSAESGSVTFYKRQTKQIIKWLQDAVEYMEK